MTIVQSGKQKGFLVGVRVDLSLHPLILIPAHSEIQTEVRMQHTLYCVPEVARHAIVTGLWAFWYKRSKSRTAYTQELQWKGVILSDARRSDCRHVCVILVQYTTVAHEVYPKMGRLRGGEVVLRPDWLLCCTAARL